MKTTTTRILFALLASAALASCSEDAELADPGGMGAGRPEAEIGSETPAESILNYAGPGALPDTGAAATGAGGAEAATPVGRPR